MKLDKFETVVNVQFTIGYDEIEVALVDYYYCAFTKHFFQPNDNMKVRKLVRSITKEQLLKSLHRRLTDHGMKFIDRFDPQSYGMGMKEHEYVMLACAVHAKRLFPHKGDCKNG